MEFRSFKPNDCLTPYIKRYWYLSTDVTSAKWHQPWLPIVEHCLIFNFNNNASTVSIKEGANKLPWCYFVGNITSPGYCIVEGSLVAFGIDFKPTSIYQLYGISLNQFLDTAVALEEVEKKQVARDLEERMMYASSPNEYIDIFEQYLIKKMLQFKPGRKIELFDPVMKLILSNKGGIQIKDITKQTFYTKKTLERHFVELVGPTPKQFQSIVRFNAVLEHLQTKRRSLKDIIYELGYFDQSHFLHDFKKLAGKTPQQTFLHATEFDKKFFGL